MPVVKCPECGAENTVKHGVHVSKSEKRQRRKRKNCGHVFLASSLGQAR